MPVAVTGVNISGMDASPNLQRDKLLISTSLSIDQLSTLLQVFATFNKWTGFLFYKSSLSKTLRSELLTFDICTRLDYII